MFYPTGESWYVQHAGLKPVDNLNHDIVYLGSITGCDDSVHAVCNRACIELGVDPKQYLSQLFAPQCSTISTAYATITAHTAPLLFRAICITTAEAVLTQNSLARYAEPLLSGYARPWLSRYSRPLLFGATAIAATAAVIKMFPTRFSPVAATDKRAASNPRPN